MASTCDISVVIPLYNKSAEIVRALSSVVAQSLQPREIIVVDDGSTDDSLAKVEAFDNPLLRVIKQENRGVSVARNVGIEAATSTWVALLDGDDLWCADFLATIAALIAEYPGCGAYGTAFYIEQDGERIAADTPSEEGVVDFFAEAMRQFFGEIWCLNSVAFRRECAWARISICGPRLRACRRWHTHLKRWRYIRVRPRIALRRFTDRR